MPVITTNGVDLNVDVSGAGSTVVLVHGFPHTHAVWAEMSAELAQDHRVIAPDLRGFGDSTLTEEGMDGETLSRDLEGLLEAVADGPATVVAIDAGVPPAFLLGARRPELISRLVLVEGTLGVLPGAETFFAGGAPWWFGFHQVPGLAEKVLAGHEAEYVGWFLDQGTRHRPVRPDLRAAIGAAFARPGALRCALGVYRAMPRTNEHIADAVQAARLTVPTTAVGAAPIGPALGNQLVGLTERLNTHSITDCGHIVPLEKPAELVAIIREQSESPVESPIVVWRGR